MRRYLAAEVDALAASAPALTAAVQVTDGGVPALPYPDGFVDAVVLCLVLCSVPDVAAAVGEARRVLGGGVEVGKVMEARA